MYQGTYYHWPKSDWDYCAPEEVALNSDKLWQASKNIEQRYTNIYSFLVVRYGKIVFEQYYRGASDIRQCDVMSVNKSIISALTGIALKEGYLTGLNQPVIPLFPEYFDADSDPCILKLSIRHLLTMTSGFYYLRLAADSQPLVKRMKRYDDWVEYILKLPIINRKMNEFNYNNFDAWLMSAVLQKVTGMSVHQFAENKLFQPTGMKIDNWVTNDSGEQIAGSLKMTARDMARFGYLYLRGGLWNDTYIIPQDWVKQSTQIHSGGCYGYFWWINHYGYYASGAGGSTILIIPDLDIVVVFQSKHLKIFKNPLEIVERYILPAVMPL